MNRLRFLSLNAITAVTALVLTACGGNPTPVSNGGDDSGTITVVSIPNYKDALTAAVKAFETVNPKITVNLQFVDVNSLYTTIRTQLTAGTAPDVFSAWPGNGTPLAMQVLVSGGYIADLSDMNLDQSLPAAMDSVTKVDGKRYVLPMALGAIGGIYNDAALKSLGLTAPTTWSGVLKLCAAAKAAGKVAYALGAQTSWNNQLILFALSASMVYGKNPNFDADQGAGKVSFANSAWQGALGKLQEMNTAGCFQESPLGTSYENATALLANGGALSMVSVSSTFAAVAAVAPSGSTFTFHALPATDNPDDTWIPAGASGAYAVNAKAKNLVGAKKFLDFLASEQTMADFATAGKVLPAIPSSKFVTPPAQKEVLPFVTANKTHPYDDQLWPNPKVATTLMDQVQKFIGGNASAADVLKAMDDTYALGANG